MLKRQRTIREGDLEDLEDRYDSTCKQMKETESKLDEAEL